ncbi:MAG: alpha/beta hydrolase [Bacteroidales bacterium]|nr:alpha/beta hydrolase [Bacteroidales bacterium]
MRRLSFISAILLLVIAGCDGIKVTKPMLRMIVSGSNKVSTAPTFADSLDKRIGVPYVSDGTPSQVLDIYYADKAVRKDAVLIDIHGGFYVAGKRQNNRGFASVFLKGGYDVVLVEYRVNDGTLDVSAGLSDCAAALDYLASNAGELGLNKDRMFLTGDSAGGHLALYMAEGSEDSAVPIRPKVFKPKGALLNCPAYDFASFADGDGFTKEALAWFIGPRYEDKAYLESLSPRTFVGSYAGPLFVSTCKNDFIRGQALMLKQDCDSIGRKIEFLDIPADDKKVGHVHNVINQELPESKTVNKRMLEFMNDILE